MSRCSKTIIQERVFQESRQWFDKLERELSLFKDAPLLALEQDYYTFENGTPYVGRATYEAAFIPDQGFDGPT